MFTNKDVADARAYRDALKELGNQVQALGMEIGKSVVPVIEPLVSGLSKFLKVSREVTGATNEQKSAWETAGSFAYHYLTPVGLVQAASEKVGHSFRALFDDMSANKGITASLSEELSHMTDTTVRAKDAATDHAVAVANETKTLDANAKFIATESIAAQKRYTEELNATTTAIQDDLAAQKSLADAYATAADKTYAVENAYAKLNTTHDGLAKAVQGAHGDATKLALVYRQVALDAEALGKAQIALAEDQATQAGTTLSAADKIDIMNTALLGQAATLDGPARQALLYHIALINGLPTDVTTWIDAQINQGDIQGATDTLNNASKARDAKILADADDAAIALAKAKLDALTNDRTVKIIPSPGGSGQGAFVGHNAGGTQNWQGGPTWVGEQGPEIVNLPGGSQVIPADKSAQMLAGPATQRAPTQAVPTFADTAAVFSAQQQAIANTAAASAAAGASDLNIARLKFQRGEMAMEQLRAMLVQAKSATVMYSTQENALYTEIQALDTQKAQSAATATAQQVAADKAAATAKAAADTAATAHREQLADTEKRYLFDTGKLSLADYLSYLGGKLAETEQYSSSWSALTNQMSSLQKAADAAAVASAAKKDAADKAATTTAQQEADNKAKYLFDTDQISLADYEAYLAGRKASFDTYSSNWMMITNQMITLQGNADKAAVAAATNAQKVIVNQAKADEALVIATKAVSDALEAYGDAATKAWVTGGDTKATDAQKLSATDAAEKARQSVITAVVHGVQARATDIGLSADTPDWVDYVRSQVGQWEKDHAGYEDGLNAFLGTLPKFHTGGIVPGSPGQEVPIMAMAGETVSKGTGGIYMPVTINANGLSLADAQMLVSTSLRDVTLSLSAGRR